MKKDKKYQEKYCDIVFKLKVLKVKNHEIYKMLHISQKTFYKWLNDYEEFKEAYEKGKNAENEVIEALHKKAVGYEYKVEEIDKDGCIHIITKYMPPETNAIKYYLKNTSDFDKEFEHKKYIDKEKLENEKFEKWLDKNEHKAYTKLREIYEKENNK